MKLMKLSLLLTLTTISILGMEQPNSTQAFFPESFTAYNEIVADSSTLEKPTIINPLEKYKNRRGKRTYDFAELTHRAKAASNQSTPEIYYPKQGNGYQESVNSVTYNFPVLKEEAKQLETDILDKKNPITTHFIYNAQRAAKKGHIALKEKAAQEAKTTSYMNQQNKQLRSRQNLTPSKRFGETELSFQPEKSQIEKDIEKEIKIIEKAIAKEKAAKRKRNLEEAKNTSQKMIDDAQLRTITNSSSKVRTGEIKFVFEQVNPAMARQKKLTTSQMLGEIKLDFTSNKKIKRSQTSPKIIYDSESE